MSYQKPLVTIELSEYNNLKQYEERFRKSRTSDYEIALSTVIQCMPASTFAVFIQSVKNRLESAGLLLLVESNGNLDDIQVYLKKI